MSKKEKTIEEEVKFEEGVSDEDLGIQINSWIKESQTYHDYLLGYQKKSEQYYLGNQTAKGDIPAHSSDSVENRIFEGVETLVPIVTSATHQFGVVPGSKSETSKLRARALNKVLDIKYRTLEMQKKLEEVVRHLLLFRFGVLKYGWDVLKDDIEVKVIDPRLILIPKLRVYPKDLPYKIEIQEYTPEEIEDYFPNTDISLLKLEQGEIETENSLVEAKKTYKVYEVWTSDYLVWFSNGQILDKKANPYYDFEGKDGKFTNFLDDPEDPYIFFTTFNTGDEPIGNTSLVEQVMDVQDEINVQKRQIIDNLRMMGNGQLFMDKDAMSKEEAESITNEVGLIVQGAGLVSEGKYRREQPLPLPTGHFANLQDSKVAFDNILGLHSATRGAAAAKTLGQDIISKQQDLTRIDLLTRVLNRGMQELTEGLVQLMKMFYTENHVFRLLGEEGAVEFVTLNGNDIEETIEIIAKAGRSPEYDRLQLSTLSIQLWQLGALSPGDLYRMMDLPNPEELEANLLAYKFGQLSMETQAEIAKSQNDAQAKAKVNPEKGRGVENSNNVVQRAQTGVSKTADTSKKSTKK